MKFLITITKDVIDRSLMCGTNGHTGISATNCAFAIAYNELVKVIVGPDIIFFEDGANKILSECDVTTAQKHFIIMFDQMRSNPQKRYELVGRQFEVEIPNKVIEHYYGDSVKAAQKIINNPILQTVNI